MTRTLPPTDSAIQQAAAALKSGELVAFPTETVYGLGADATSDSAVARIFAAKERPHFNPLIVHFPDADAAAAAAAFDARARRLAEAFWPGPLSLVLPRRADCRVSLLCSAGLDSLAVRVPGQATALRLLAAVGRPLAAPSANRSGRISPTTAAHVAEELSGRVAVILDDGPCRIGLESTVVSLTGTAPLLLRQGGVAEDDLAEILGPLARPPAEHRPGAALDSPGQLASHYAPAFPSDSTRARPVRTRRCSPSARSCPPARPWCAT